MFVESGGATLEASAIPPGETEVFLMHHNVVVLVHDDLDSTLNEVIGGELTPGQSSSELLEHVFGLLRPVMHRAVVG